ncbi:MAG TPA: protein kinase [Kofleriaceae bacterium]|nr:protein kinase [Kofleriaceae bacterium]
MNLDDVARGPLLYRDNFLECYRTQPIHGEPAELWVLPEQFRDPTFVAMFEDAATFLAHYPLASLPKPIASSPTALLVTAPPWVALKHVIAGAPQGVPLGLALTFVHALARDLAQLPRPVVLRSIAPNSLAISTAGQPRLLDTTIARFAGRQTQTSPGIIKGQIRYMSPELAGGRSLAGTSDVFALALVTFELLTGVAAFERRSTELDTLLQIVQGRAPALRSHRSDLPAAMYRLLDHMLATQPHERADAGHVVRMIQHELAGELWSGDRMFDEVRRIAPAAVDAALLYGY